MGVVDRKTRNRLSAARCRRQKKHEFDQLKETVNQLKAENVRLRHEIRQLQLANTHIVDLEQPATIIQSTFLVGLPVITGFSNSVDL